jgi:hypothetical protein
MSAPETHKLSPEYPEGFHGTEIPVDGTLVAKLIEDHIDEALATSRTIITSKNTSPSRPHEEI